MRKLLVDKYIDIDVDRYDGYVCSEGEISLIRVNTHNDTIRTVSMDAKEARRIGKQLVKFADTYDARVTKANVRGKAIALKHKD